MDVSKQVATLESVAPKLPVEPKEILPGTTELGTVMGSDYAQYKFRVSDTTKMVAIKYLVA